MPKYLWKSLSAGLNSYHGKKKWKIGKWYKCRGELEMCKNGLHASERVIDAMQYVPMECLAKVEVRGENIQGDNKQCYRKMKIVKTWHWKKEDGVALAIYAAELVIANFEKKYPDDDRPRKAIQAAKKWLREPTEENQGAAESAARSAAESARSAAWSVWSARSAAESAARFAAESARSAAFEKILDECEKWIQKRITTLDENN